MNATLQHVTEKIPFMGSKPIEPEIGYRDIDEKTGEPIPPVLIFLKPEAFRDAQEAARKLGYSALSTNMQDRMDRGFDPVLSDESRADERALNEWKAGNYDPNVFHGQGAVALRWLLEEAASNPERGGVPGHKLSPTLAGRMALLHKTTKPMNSVKEAALPEVIEISEAVITQGPDPDALITNDGSLTKLQEVGGFDYGAFHDTDPAIQKIHHDASV